jgi:hypothetical protein
VPSEEVVELALALVEAELPISHKEKCTSNGEPTARHGEREQKKELIDRKNGCVVCHKRTGLAEERQSHGLRIVIF